MSIATLVKIAAAAAGLLFLLAGGSGGWVSGHTKNQAYGPNWSRHRSIRVRKYKRK